MYILKYFNPNDYLTLFLPKTGLETERLLINFPFVLKQATIYKANRQITSNRRDTQHKVVCFSN